MSPFITRMWSFNTMSEAPLVAAVVRSEPASEYRLFAAAIREHVRHAAKPIQEPPAAQ